MKYLSEYREPELVQQYLQELQRVITRPWTIMEICGGQTHSLVKNGLLELLPPQITMVHGPGCPVCVTPVSVLDEAMLLARQPGMIFCTFGDMMRVPGSQESLLEVRAGGADIRVLYSPLEAVEIAAHHPGREVVFFAVGFETTAPANALSVLQAEQLELQNFSLLTSQVRVPPAMEAILADPECRVSAFLAAGHVCTIMGWEEYLPVAEKYRVPIVVTGFEPADLLQGILMAVRQLESGTWHVENPYSRYVQREGNREARQAVAEVFTPADRNWRGLGALPASGFELQHRYRRFNARLRFQLPPEQAETVGACISGDIMRGLRKPPQCPLFGRGCTPEHPAGAPMVSSEGACAAYYHYSTETP